MLAQAGCSPPGRYSLCVLSDDSPDVTINGATFSASDVVVWPPGHEFDGITPAGMGICVVSLAHRPDQPVSRAQADRPFHNPAAARRVWEFLCEGIDQFCRHPQALEYSAAVTTFIGTLEERLVPLLPPDREDEMGGTRGSVHRLQQFRRARDAIHERLDQGISVGCLCASVGVSRRSLERTFLSTLGISPARYVRMLQLNRIRKDLLSPERRAESIGDIAARWGIWHWSRFSHDYRLMFGELPSQTRLTQNG